MTGSSGSGFSKGQKVRENGRLIPARREGGLDNTRINPGR